MKIILIDTWGDLPRGSVVDAGLSLDKTRAVFFDNAGTYWCVDKADFNILPEEKFEQVETTTYGGMTILDVLGGDVKKLQLDVEFK